MTYDRAGGVSKACRHRPRRQIILAIIINPSAPRGPNAPSDRFTDTRSRPLFSISFRDEHSFLLNIFLCPMPGKKSAT